MYYISLYDTVISLYNHIYRLLVVNSTYKYTKNTLKLIFYCLSQFTIFYSNKSSSNKLSCWLFLSMARRGFVSCSLALSLVTSEISISFLSTIPRSLDTIPRPLGTIFCALIIFLVPRHHPSLSSAQFLIPQRSSRYLFCIMTL